MTNVQQKFWLSVTSYNEVMQLTSQHAEKLRPARSCRHTLFDLSVQLVSESSESNRQPSKAGSDYNVL